MFGGEMMAYYNSVSELVGKTPIVRLNNIENNNSLVGEIYAKVEFFNPAGSTKDRAALRMIDDAMERGIISQKSVIIEPTSGNTGVALAAICASRGLKLVIVMPENMSEERRTLMRAYGAELVLTDASLGMVGAIKKAEEIKASTEGAVIMGQFDNPANPEAHYLSTGPEIWADLNGELDILVATVGTGGTLSGTARYLKEKNPEIKVVAVEPQGSPYISEGRAGAHAIQGIGAGFIPGNLDLSLIDEVLTVTDESAFDNSRELARAEGLLVGISSGAALSAAKVIAARAENADKKIVVILPDTGERYLSSKLF